MRGQVRSTARRPSYEGTETVSWATVTTTFAAYRDGYYRHNGVTRPDEVPSRVQDAPAAMKTWIASKTLLGEASADNDRDLVFFPVVNAGTNKLNEGALRAVLGGRGAAADIPATALESARSQARRLLNSEFDANLEVEMDKHGRFKTAINTILHFASSGSEGNEDAPIEPGARWNIDPCVAAPPLK